MYNPHVYFPIICMKNGLLKVFTVVVLTMVLWIFVFPWDTFGIKVPFSGESYRLWLDLQWWVELDYKVDLDEVRKDPTNTIKNEKAIVEWLKSIIDRRVEVLHINDSIISSASYGTEQHIIVQVPLKWNDQFQNQENIKKAKEAIGRVVRIEFKEKRKSITDADIKERSTLAQTALKEFQESKYDFSVTATKYKDSYENVDYGTLTGTTDVLKKYFDTKKLAWITWILPKVLSGTGRSVNVLQDGTFQEKFTGSGYWIVKVKDFSKNVYTLDYIFITQAPSDWMPAKDSKWRILNDKYFSKSSVQYNQAFQPQVELTFNDDWAQIFGELTQRLVGQQIAIFVGGQLLTSPRVNEPILSGKAVITGSYTSEEAKNLSQNINTWVVPAPIYLTSERTIDSKLGLNSLQKLIYSGLVGFLVIVGFLLYTYRITWVIASFALLLYVLLVLGIVKIFSIILTLASIAGLILSIGMAIDTNILISERIKDEIRDNKKIDDALKLWFKWAFTAVWDTHLTGFIVALVLYIFWINLIKWFGLMLGIGTIVSIFVFYNISRVFIFVFGKRWYSSKKFIGMKHE